MNSPSILSFCLFFFFFLSSEWAQVPFRKIENPKVQETATLLPIKLYKAVQDGYVRAIGSNPKSYQSIELELENLKPFRLDIDISGSHLLPRGGRCQRLGLGPITSISGPIRRESGSAIVPLEAHERRKMTVSTCCLDAGKPSPSTETFDGATVALPEIREKVLRWWVEHPETPQGDVNASIWQNKDCVIVSSRSSVQKMKSVVLCSGSYYQLKEGTLLSLTPEGSQKFLGTNILQVIPTPAVVYAVTLEKEGTDETEIPVLWSLSITGEESWIRITSLPFYEKIQDILLDAKQNLVLVSASGVKIYDRNKKQFTDLFRSLNHPFSIHRRSATSLTIAIKTQNEETFDCRSSIDRSSKAIITELWELNFAKKSGRLLQRVFGAEIQAGKAGVFSVSKQGHLARFSHESFKTMAREAFLREVLAVGPQIIWALDLEKKLIALHPETGQILWRPELAQINTKNLVEIDAETGDLALQVEEKLYRIRAIDGTVQELITLGQEEKLAEGGASTESSEKSETISVR
ncbi:MAG: hypothetical protein AABZ60_16435 [Planctomycetota bacterium]